MNNFSNDKKKQQIFYRRGGQDDTLSRRWLRSMESHLNRPEAMYGRDDSFSLNLLLHRTVRSLSLIHI